MIHKNRGNRRKMNMLKARRKQKIAKEVYPFSEHEYYKHLHQYSKNKIHCSCPLCRAKTKDKYWGENWKPSDLRKIEALDYQEQKYIEGYL